MSRRHSLVALLVATGLVPSGLTAETATLEEPPPAESPRSGAEHGHHGHHGDSAETTQHDGQEGAAHDEIDIHRPGMQHDFSDVAKYEKSFDNPERVAWQKPEHVIDLLAIAPGMTVADIGAGTGFFEPFLAKAVGDAGRVLALDVEPKMVEHLSRRAKEAGLAQIEAREVAPGDPGLAAASVDRILVVNTWHHIDDRGAYAAKLRQALRPGGSIWIVDFEHDSSKGPPAGHKLRPRQVIAELEAGGLVAAAVDEELSEQYVIVARSD